jgi:hypothetical protein
MVPVFRGDEKRVWKWLEEQPDLSKPEPIIGHKGEVSLAGMSQEERDAVVLAMSEAKI